MSFYYLLRKKYLDACYTGDIETVEYMIKKEGKTLKNTKFLKDCLNMACKGDNNGSNINVCKAIYEYKEITNFYDFNEFTYDACRAGKLELVMYYLEIKTYKNVCLYLCLCTSCYSGNLELIKIMLKKIEYKLDSKYLDICIQNVCESGNMKSVELILSCAYFSCYKSHSKYDWNLYLRKACRGGNLEIVKLMITKGAFDFTGCLSHAGFGGNVKIVKLLLKKGSTDLYECIYEACKRDKLEIVKFILENTRNIKNIGNIINSDHIEKYMDTACEHGSINTVTYLINKGCVNWGRYSEVLCMRPYDNTKIIKLMIENGVTNYDKFMYHACLHGHLEFVKVLIEKGATNWYNGLEGACYGGYPDLMILMIECGATDLNKLNNYLVYNYMCGFNADIGNVLISNGANTFFNLSRTTDFKLYSLYCKTNGIVYNKCDEYEYGNKWTKLYNEYPPCVLLVGSKLSKKCCVKKLPVELFTLLHKF